MSADRESRKDWQEPIMKIADAIDALVVSAVRAEREACAKKAREYAEHYPDGSDGRNTFVLLAEWIESRT